MSGFSGYVAADEVYDGPFCILSLVDNRTYRRLIYEVLDKDPKKEDVERFFRRLQGALDARGLVLRGITTDGSPLYPPAVASVFEGAAHQVCEFHALKDIGFAVLRTLSKMRRQLQAQVPRLMVGRPKGREAKRFARRAIRGRKRVAELYEHRHLFVRRDLTESERRTLHRITRGLPRLRPLREIMEEVYRLFDRRCRVDTALEKLAKLRRRVQRFGGLRRALRPLFSPFLERALTFLDDAMLPSTSNAVERGNRRHRKMQKSIYRVRSSKALVGRIALDLERDRHRASQALTLDVLHGERSPESADRARTPARHARGSPKRHAARPQLKRVA